MNHSEKVVRAWVEEVEAAAVECHRLARQYWADHRGVGVSNSSLMAAHDAVKLLDSFARDEFYFVLPFIKRYREARQYLEAAWMASYCSARLQSWAVEFIEAAAQ